MVIVYQAPFLAISYSICTQILNKYSVVMLLVAVYFSTKKKCIITKYSNEKIYDVNLLHISLSEKIQKINLVYTFLVDNKFLKATNLNHTVE